MKLKFQRAQSETDVQNVYEYNIDAFSESPDFNWNLDEIKKEIASGWIFILQILMMKLSLRYFKKDRAIPYSKTTSIKINFQGSGYSHKIKEFIEESAVKLKAKEIINFCGIDNFRMYSLNESHGYTKTVENLAIMAKLSNG